MTPNVLSILIIGGEASTGIESMPTAGGQGYIPRLIQQLQQAGWSVQLECHAPVDIDMALPVLHRLNLNRFDLILLQLGHARLQCPPTFINLLRPGNYRSFDPAAKPMSIDNIAARSSANNTQSQATTSGWLGQLQAQCQLVTLQVLGLLRLVGRLREVEAQLIDLFYFLQPYRRRLVALTPLPHPHPVSNWLRQKGRLLLGQHGRRSMVPVFDTTTIIGTGEEYFTDCCQGNLSSVAGDLLGQSLFDFIQMNALLPARPGLRQRRGY